MIIFKPEEHQYVTIDPTENITWTSVTSLVSKFKKKFDPFEQSVKSSRNKKSKWYGMDPAEIRSIWNAESARAVDLGNWYHKQREDDLMGIDTIMRGGIHVPIIKPLYENGYKIAPEQRLTEGIYPEHLMYLKSHGICGQSDRVEVIDSHVNIIDYKTNKEIKTEGFKSWDGTVQKMEQPLHHLDDCNFNHYALQLSIYMYIVLRHNPIYKPGKMTLHHILFEEEPDKDKYGNPVAVRDHNGDPVVKEVIPYDVPYLRNEVTNILKLIKP